MRISMIWAVLGLAVTLAGAPAVAQAPQHKHYEEAEGTESAAPTGALVPRLQSLGRHRFLVTTASAQAQAFIDQGVNLSYGFNHAEAGRAFREAARLDPDGAMAYWGQSLVLGPNINVPMDPADEPKALELVRQAVAMRGGVSPREQAYIDALAERYAGKPGKPEERPARDRAYADAMRGVMLRYPDDLDAATLFAEALMDLRPWNYWTRDGKPYPETLEVVAVLESVLDRNPMHPGAAHLYIHAMEATQPKRAEAAADRLAGLMPGAGHMVHMPAHIYMRVGRYADASAANEQAILADEDYIAQCRAQGIYPMAYYPHNIHFLWAAATMEGRSAVALEAAKKVASQVSDEMMEQLPILGGFRVVRYYALTRFGHWDEMLAEPSPPASQPYVKATWHYARGLAFVRTGKTDKAEGELAALRKALEQIPPEMTLFSPNRARAILGIGPEVLAGEIAAARKDYDRAVAHLEKAVRLEDGLTYTEPEEWHFSPRLALGAVLLDAGRAAEAETVYWDELRQSPEGGWALYGVVRALEAQGQGRRSRHGQGALPTGLGPGGRGVERVANVGRSGCRPQLLKAAQSSAGAASSHS